MAMRTAEDVANMESEIHDLRALVDDYKTKFTQADTERKMLKVEVVILQRKADERLERMTKVESMMTHLASGLHAGLKEMREERDIERAVRRQSQESQLVEETGPAPTFLRTPENSRLVISGQESDNQHPPAAPEVRARESDQDREDRLRGAAERIRPMPPPFRPGRVDTSLAAHDMRLPPHVDYSDGRPVVNPTRQEHDDENLLRLAGNMDQRTR